MASLLALVAVSACGPQTGSGAEAGPAATAAIAAPAVTAAASGVAARPVMMGGDADMDACAGLSRVKSGRVVLIRNAPDGNAGIVASLPEGTALWVCDEEGASGGWTGVAFDRPDGPQTCEGPASPSADKVPVPAVCQSGWAQFGDNVEDLAG